MCTQLCGSYIILKDKPHLKPKNYSFYIPRDRKVTEKKNVVTLNLCN